MNKKELSRYLAKRCDLKISQSQKIIDNLIEVIILALKRGEEVNLNGFGKFWANFKKGTVKRVPRTTILMAIPSQFIPKFRCSKSLKKQFLLDFG